MHMARKEVVFVLWRLGVPAMECWLYEEGEQPTLAAWLRKRSSCQMAQTYLVTLTAHFVVVRGRKFIDNHTMTPTWIRRAPYRRARVIAVNRVD